MSTPTPGWSLRHDPTFFEQARRSGNRAFTIYALPYSSFESIVIVPKTVIHLAHERNQLKRRLKAILAKIKRNPQTPLLKLVVTPRHAATTLSFSQLEENLLHALTKI